MEIKRWRRRRPSCGGYGFAFVLQRGGESLNGGEEVKKEMKNGYRRENGKKEREGVELREKKIRKRVHAE